MTIPGSAARWARVALLSASAATAQVRDAGAQAPPAGNQATPPGHQAPHPGRKAAQPAPPPEPAAAPVVLPDPPTPVQQALAVGLGQCGPTLDAMARKTLTARYDVQSGWSRTDPTHHIFQSIAALNTPGNTPPDGFAALVAAPLSPERCDGVSVQVFPLAGDCQNAQKTILQGGQTLGPLMNARIMLDARSNRIVLLPGYNKTCIAIAVDTHFDPR